MPLAVRGVRELKSRVVAMRDRARDMTPLLETFRRELEAMVDRAWVERRSPGGDAWPPLRGPSESDGGLRRDTIVVVDGLRRIRFLCRTPHAVWQYFGTPTLPARNPLPVEPRGGVIVWMDRGDARAWMESARARVRAYLEATDAGGAS